MLEASDHRPTDSAVERFGHLEEEFRALSRRTDELLGPELSEVDALLRERGLEPVTSEERADREARGG